MEIVFYFDFQGYHKNEEAYDDLVSDDGWLKTGDILYVDENEFLFYVERKKFSYKFMDSLVSNNLREHKKTNNFRYSNKLFQNRESLFMLPIDDVDCCHRYQRIKRPGAVTKYVVSSNLVTIATKTQSR